MCGFRTYILGWLSNDSFVGEGRIRYFIKSQGFSFCAISVLELIAGLGVGGGLVLILFILIKASHTPCGFHHHQKAGSKVNIIWLFVLYLCHLYPFLHCLMLLPHILVLVSILLVPHCRLTEFVNPGKSV